MNVKNVSLANKFSLVTYIFELNIDNQKKVAHNAIDSDDWDKLQEVIKNISLINSWSSLLKSIDDDISQADIIKSDNFITKTNDVSEIITFLEAIIAKKKESVNNALLMDDWNKGQELLTEIREQIFKIKAWVNSLKSINDAILESKIIDFDIQKESEVITDDSVFEKENNISEEPDKENHLNIDKACLTKADYFMDGAISKSKVDAVNIQKKGEVITDDIVPEKENNISEESGNKNHLHSDDFYSKRAVPFWNGIISNPKISEFNINITSENVTDSTISDKKDNISKDTINENHLTVNDDFCSKKVISFCFDGKKYLVNDLTEALIKICDLLYELDKDTFEKMLEETFVYGKHNIYLTLFPRGSYYQKMNKADIYVWTNTNSNAKIQLISHMMEYFGLSKDDITFEIRSDYNPEKRVVSPRNEEKQSNSKYNNNEDLNDIIDIIVGTAPKNDESGKVNSNEQNESEFNIISFCEENILKNPYLMAVINYDSMVGNMFTENEYEAKTNMKKPTQLSNGLWIDADITNINGKDIQQLKKLFS